LSHCKTQEEFSDLLAKIMAGPYYPTPIKSQSISIFPQRLRPIIYLTRTTLILIDFLNGRLISVDKSTLPSQLSIYYAKIEISCKDDKIYFQVNQSELLVCCFVIDLGSMMLNLCGIPKFENKEIFHGRVDIDGSKIFLKYEDGTEFDCDDSLRIAITKNGVRNRGIYMASPLGPRLVKLHPRTNDPSGFYKNYFCWQYKNELRIGTIQNCELYTQQLISPLFENIFRFCLTEDNILVLFIPNQLVFIDANDVKIIACIEADHDPSDRDKSDYIFGELIPNRKDILMLRSRLTSLIHPCLLPPLVDIILVYILDETRIRGS